MTVKELIDKLKEYPDDFKVVCQIPDDYKDYGEIYSLRPVEYERFRGGSIDIESNNPNAIYIS